MQISVKINFVWDQDILEQKSANRRSHIQNNIPLAVY